MEPLVFAAFLAAPAPAVDFAAFPAADRPPTYAEAYHRALTTGRPLLVWVGGNFCPRCVNDTAGEFVHAFVDSFPEAVVPSVVVAVPEGGQLTRVADVTSWVEGDATFGHIPSVRRVLANRRPVRRALGAVAQAAARPMAVAPPAPMLPMTLIPVTSPPAAPVYKLPQNFQTIYTSPPVMMRPGPPVRVGFGRARGGC